MEFASVPSVSEVTQFLYKSYARTASRLSGTMLEPGVEKSLHFQCLLVPGVVGLLLFVTSAPVFPWWVGVAIYPFLFMAYAHLYSLCFPPRFEKNDIRGWLLSIGLALFQVVFWVILFAIARHEYVESLAQ
jgi:hypothetical protein